MYSFPLEFMMRVLMTSKGEQTVVATRPANKLAEKCVVTLSLKKLCNDNQKKNAIPHQKSSKEKTERKKEKKNKQAAHPEARSICLNWS